MIIVSPTDKEKISKLVNKVVEEKDKKIKQKASIGLTQEDFLMWDRIFNQPEPEPIYQPHFALTAEWKTKHPRQK